MILIIDNYDSFTYNLVQYIGAINSNLEVHRNDKLTLNDITNISPEKIVISPGPSKIMTILLGLDFSLIRAIAICLLLITNAPFTQLSSPGFL